MGTRRDLVGKKFGRLTVIEAAPDSERTGKGPKDRWLCLCICGNKKVIAGSNLASGNTKSCGCLHKEICSEIKFVHGMGSLPEYGVWKGVRRRCRDKTFPSYKWYGGRGIVCCNRWGSFKNFYSDMGPRPTPTHSIDRINPNGNYEPSNCRWATPKEQARNKRNNTYLINPATGEGKLISDWSVDLGGSPTLVRARLRLGWSLTRALTTKKLGVRQT